MLQRRLPHEDMKGLAQQLLIYKKIPGTELSKM